ncbi:hypothetical protein Ndes2526B_g06890 [Nannochloris sp. 'desiccata']|nr:hypothetical protein KSW81_005011 [Chlorella desiccata (nom. nud.)]KAH7617997.1 hypothetical protein NADE_000198 [Chlorella desiccata (nom. nud.)]
MSIGNSGVSQISTDPALLPRAVALRILSLAYVIRSEDNSGNTDANIQANSFANNPLRTTVPLVSKSWQQLLKTEEAHKVLWHRVRIYDSFIPKSFDLLSFTAFWSPRSNFILELDVNLNGKDPATCSALSSALSGLIGVTLNLKTLRVTGPLSVGSMFTNLGEQLSQLTALSSIYLAGGSPGTWQLEDALKALSILHALQKVEIRFNNDTEGVSSAILDSICHLTSLSHLSLQWPLRSALPPMGELPAVFSSLSSLTTLQLKRVPLQTASPGWLGHFPALQHLFWDPYLPVDVTGVLPKQLASMPLLRTLYAEMRPPLFLPPGLTALERLTLVGRGQPDPSLTPQQAAPNWDWLQPLSSLVSLRLQGGNITVLPESVRVLSKVTRLELMCNEITAEKLLPGPWLQSVQHLHLGCNQIQEFPAALHSATALQSLHLANQRSVAGVHQGPNSVTQRLKLTGDDVAALLAAPHLTTVVVGMTQPQVLMGGRTCDFDWLQRVLRQRRSIHSGPIKLTSKELAYELEEMEVFKVPHLTNDELSLDDEPQN